MTTRKYRFAKIEIKGLSPEREYDIKLFHKFTKQENSILILSIKLMLLIIVTCISNIISFILWEFGVSAAYVFDSTVNIYCVWLALSMSEKYYFYIFGGKYCNKCMFPWIKMYALTCCGECYGSDVYIVDEKEIHDSSGICGCCHEATVRERKRVLKLSEKEYQMMENKRKNKKNQKSTIINKTKGKNTKKIRKNNKMKANLKMQQQNHEKDPTTTTTMTEKTKIEKPPNQ